MGSFRERHRYGIAQERQRDTFSPQDRHGIASGETEGHFLATGSLQSALTYMYVHLSEFGA